MHGRTLERWYMRALGHLGTQRRAMAALTAIVLLAVLALWLRMPAPPRPKAPTPVHPLLHAEREALRLLMSAPARLLPHAYWEHRRTHAARYDDLSCSAFPTLDQLEWAAPGWQRLAVPLSLAKGIRPDDAGGAGRGGSVYLYGAYWDARGVEPLVRILVYCDVTPLPNITCLLWYGERNSPEAVPAQATYGWHEYWNGLKDTVNEPYVLACVPTSGRVPRALSLGTAQGTCQAPLNVLAVQGAPETDRDPPTALPLNDTSVAVALKWLDYAHDKSSDLVEWIELLRELGADKIYMHVLNLHPNMRRVVAHYVAEGLVEASAHAHAPRRRERGSDEARAFNSLRRQLLPLNDALYRALHARFSWLAVMDMDELIVPLQDNSWPALIARTQRALDGDKAGGVDALVCRNYYFLEHVQKERAAPPPAHMLAQVWRARKPSPSGYYVKSLYNVSSVVAMHNHMPMSCGARDCRIHDVPLDIARLHHYRPLCAAGNICGDLKDVVRDVTLARFLRVLVRARQVMTALGLPLAQPTMPAAPAPSPASSPALSPSPADRTATPAITATLSF